MNMPEQFCGVSPVVMRRKVKWGDCDPAGVVYTPRFADYAVEGSLAFLQQLFGGPPLVRLAPLNLTLPARAITIDFKRSLWPDQLFDMTITVGEVRTRSFDLDMRATSAGDEVFLAKLTLITVDAAAREARALPGFVKELLREYSEGCARAGS